MSTAQDKGKLESVLDKSLEEINQYCNSLRSSVTFIGHIDLPDTLNIYPSIYVSDALKIRVNITDIEKGRVEIIDILAKNGVSAIYERDAETGVGFVGTLAESEVQNG